MIIIRIILLTTMGYLLTACSLLSPVKTECINEYVVDKVPFVKKHSMTRKTLAVMLPTSQYVYKTKDMAYSTHAYKIAYFAKNRWVEPPAYMLQPLIIQVLQNTEHFKAVAPSTGIGRFDFALNTQILEFQQNFFAQCSVFKFTLRAQLININTGRVLASKEFVVEEPAPTPNPYGGVVAANNATAKILSQLAAWSVRYI